VGLIKQEGEGNMKHHKIFNYSEWDRNRIGIASTTLTNEDRILTSGRRIPLAQEPAWRRNSPEEYHQGMTLKARVVAYAFKKILCGA
jgi:hypothetical protein